MSEAIVTQPGPLLEPLMRRLADTPRDFLAEPRIAGKGVVHVAAVVGDLLAMHGGTATTAALAAFVGAEPARDRNPLRVVLVQAWLLSDPYFVAMRVPAAQLIAIFEVGAGELSPYATATAFVDDVERREELVRHLLAQLGLHPAGERAAAAQDRLTSLSAATRARLLRASRAAEARAKTIREALAKKAAEEAADKWTRE